MSLLHTFLVCLFAFAVALAEPKEGTETNDDIHKFLNANDKIWVYNTSEENEKDITCRYDVRVTITQKGISFHRYNNTSTPELLKGEFLNWNDPKSNTYDAMYVTDAANNSVTDEVIEYVSSDNSCAVVSVSLMRTAHTETLREIRVPENALENEPEEGCKKKFEEILRLANKTARSHYSPSCKNKSTSTLLTQ
uniref:Putative lipocalin-3 1 n=1 Tax=Amblyomma cajennense TaxID=34607 RepID=A0A023FU11_AMBCJ